jgi:hypothetical protein
MAVQTVFEGLGLFRFDPEAPAEVDRHFVAVPGAEPAAEVTRVSAAELAALRWQLERIGWSGEVRSGDEPIPVTRSDARLALAKAVCSPYYGCLPGQVSPPRLWDVVVFAGDMAKLDGLGLEDPTAIREDPARVAEALELRYQQSGVDWGQQFAETGYVRLEVFLWASKLELIVNPQHAEEEMRKHARSLGLASGESTGADTSVS